MKIVSQLVVAGRGSLVEPRVWRSTEASFVQLETG